jgi:hypothetical protein
MTNEPVTMLDDDMLDDAKAEASGAMEQLQLLINHTEFGLGFRKLGQLRDRCDNLADNGGRIHLSPDEALSVAASLDLAMALLQQLPPVSDAE